MAEINPFKDGYYDLSFLTEEELIEMDQGRFLCAVCGQYFAPQGEEGHLDCPVEENRI